MTQEEGDDLETTTTGSYHLLSGSDSFLVAIQPTGNPCELPLIKVIRMRAHEQ